MIATAVVVSRGGGKCLNNLIVTWVKIWMHYILQKLITTLKMNNTVDIFNMQINQYIDEAENK